MLQVNTWIQVTFLCIRLFFCKIWFELLNGLYTNENFVGSGLLCCGEVTKGTSRSIYSEEDSCPYERGVLPCCREGFGDDKEKRSSLSKVVRWPCSYLFITQLWFPFNLLFSFLKNQVVLACNSIVIRYSIYHYDPIAWLPQLQVCHRFL